MNYLEKLFIQEVCEKKKIGNCIKYKTGKRGYTGTIKTPADLLKYNNKKAYKEYIKGGEVKVSNAFEVLNNIPSYAELDNMSIAKAHGIISTAKKFHSVSKLRNYWGTSGYMTYKLLRKVGIEVKKRDKVVDKEETTAAPDLIVEDITPVQITNQHKEVVEIMEDGLVLQYNKAQSTGAELQEVVTNYMAVLQADKDYKISITIIEKTK